MRWRFVIICWVIIITDNFPDSYVNDYWSHVQLSSWENTSKCAAPKLSPRKMHLCQFSNPKQRAAGGRGPPTPAQRASTAGQKPQGLLGNTQRLLTVPFPLAGASSLPFSFAASLVSSTTSFFSFSSWNEAKVCRLINKPHDAVDCTPLENFHVGIGESLLSRASSTPTHTDEPQTTHTSWLDAY